MGVLAFEGPRAAQDHIHPMDWFSPIIPAVEKAATEMQTNAHGGVLGLTDSVSTYGFLDGHALALEFREVYTDPAHNLFDPGVAR